MSVCLIDTSVLCNLVPIPGRDQARDEIDAQFRQLVRDGATFMLPMAAIVEAGNLVGLCGDGSQRRMAAERFVIFVADAVEGRMPFIPTPVCDPATLLKWLADFPDSASRGVGLADLSIIKEFEEQHARHPHRRVRIWSLDRHLQGYDTVP